MTNTMNIGRTVSGIMNMSAGSSSSKAPSCTCSAIAKTIRHAISADVKTATASRWFWIWPDERAASPSSDAS